MFTASQSGCKVFDLCLKGSWFKCIMCPGVHCFTADRQNNHEGKKAGKDYVKMQNNEIKNKRKTASVQYFYSA